MAASFAPQPPEYSIGSTPKPFHLITTTAALRLARFLRHSFVSHGHHFGSILHSQNIPHLGHVLQLNKISHQFNWFKLPQWPHDSWPTTFSSTTLFFGGEGNETNYGDQEMEFLRIPTRDPVNKKTLTNMLLAINVLVYVAQVASQGKLLKWGSKVNGLIDKGELWRLVTSSFLHANVEHLLFGSFAIFAWRHNNMIEGGVVDLKFVACAIALDMVFGLFIRRIDNWGHLGGLIGGIATSWLIGPAWKFESTSRHGRQILIDKAPIFSLLGTKRASQ